MKAEFNSEPLEINTNLEKELKFQSANVADITGKRDLIFLFTSEIKSEQKICKQIEIILNEEFYPMWEVADLMIEDKYDNDFLINDILELEVKLELLILKIFSLLQNIKNKDSSSLNFIISTRNILRIKINRLVNKPILKKPHTRKTKYDNAELALLFQLLGMQKIIEADANKIGLLIQDITGIQSPKQLTKVFSKQVEGKGKTGKFTQANLKNVAKDLTEMLKVLDKHIEKE